MNLLLVDDHPIFLEGLKNLLTARGINVIATASNGNEALEKVSNLLPDVILMDIMMKPLTGLQTTRILKKRFPDVKIIMLTASETEDDLFESLKSGASGYLLKSLNGDILYDMLLQYEQGEVPISPGVATRLLEKFKKNDSGQLQEDSSDDDENDEKISRLSSRQKEVLIHVAKGLKYRDIAEKLGVTERTVKYYMEMILKKLHMESRSQAVRYAIKEGLADD